MGISELRPVTMSWVSENFADYEADIVYHDDNEYGIPHAHVVVNNTNLEMGQSLQDPDPRALGTPKFMCADCGYTWPKGF